MRDFWIGLFLCICGSVFLFTAYLSLHKWWIGKPVAYVVGRTQDQDGSMSFPIYRDRDIGHAISRCFHEGFAQCEIPAGSWHSGCIEVPHDTQLLFHAGAQIMIREEKHGAHTDTVIIPH